MVGGASQRRGMLLYCSVFLVSSQAAGGEGGLPAPPEEVEHHPLPPPPAAAVVIPPLPGDGEGGGKGKGRGKGKRAQGPAWSSWNILDADGVHLGCIKWGESDQILCAHCEVKAPGQEFKQHGLCRVNRTVKAHATKPWQGRPLGFLVAWLRKARLDTCDDRASHKDHLSLLSLQERQVARTWLINSANFNALLDFERPRFPGEAEEPEVYE